jgi:prolyl 4-hydroxylase
MKLQSNGLIFLILIALKMIMPSVLAAECLSHLQYKQDPELPSNGMHIICTSPTSTGIKVKGILNSVSEVEFHFWKDSGDIQLLMNEMYNLFGTSNNREASKWRAFTTKGSPIFSIDGLLYHRTAVIHTNGLWLWPGAYEGFRQETFEGIRLTTLSVRPLVHRVENLLTYEECDLIQSLALPYMRASKTNKMDKDVDKPDTTWRTSTQYFLPPTSHASIEAIDYRVASLTKSRLAQQEWVQVLRYEKTQQYKHHTDYFDKSLYQSDKSVLKMLKGGEMNRLITVFWYLSNVTSGGHTIFPWANKSKGGWTSSDCDIPTALKVKPIKGEAIIFYSLNSDGSMDDKSLHGGCPVIEGTKWSGNKWIWYSYLFILINNLFDNWFPY